MDSVDTGAEQRLDDQSDASSKEKPKLSLEVQIDAPSACERHVTVTIAEEDVQRYWKEAFTELMPKANVPGFRPGRAPRKLVEQWYRKQVADQVKGSLLLDSMTQVTESESLAAISEPEFDPEAIELPDEGPMTFEFDLEVRPDFPTPQWQGLRLYRPVHEFTDKEIDEALESLISSAAELEDVEAVEEIGDHVVVNAEFRCEGEVLSRLNEELIAVRRELSFSDGILPQFDKLMMGAKAGDRRTTVVQVSHDAPNEKVRGKDVEVEFEVLKVQRMRPPQVTQAILDAFGMESEGELRDAVHFRLKQQLAYHQQQKIRQQITEQLTATANWDLPPELVRRQSRRELERAILELRGSGFTDEQIQRYRNQLRQNSHKATERALKEHFIFERIAEDQGIEATEDDYDAEVRLIAAQRDESPRRVRAQIEKRGMMDALRNQIIERKVIELICSKAEFKDEPFEPKREEVEAIEHFIGGQPESDIPVAKYADEPRNLDQPADYT